MKLAWIEEAAANLIAVCQRASSEEVSADWSAFVERVTQQVVESGLPNPGLAWPMIIQKAVEVPSKVPPSLAVLAVENGLIYPISARVNGLPEQTVDAILSCFTNHFANLRSSDSDSRTQLNDGVPPLMRARDIVAVIPRFLQSAHADRVQQWADPIRDFTRPQPAALLTDEDENVRCYAAIGLLADVTDQREASTLRADAIRSLMNSEFGEDCVSGCMFPRELLLTAFPVGDPLTRKWAFLLAQQPAVLASPELVASLAPWLSATDRAGLTVHAIERLKIPEKLELAAEYLDAYVLPSKEATNDLFDAFEFEKLVPPELLTIDRLKQMLSLVDDVDIKFWLVDRLDEQMETES